MKRASPWSSNDICIIIWRVYCIVIDKIHKIIIIIICISKISDIPAVGPNNDVSIPLSVIAGSSMIPTMSSFVILMMPKARSREDKSEIFQQKGGIEISIIAIGVYVNIAPSIVIEESTRKDGVGVDIDIWVSVIQTSTSVQFDFGHCWLTSGGVLSAGTIFKTKIVTVFFFLGSIAAIALWCLNWFWPFVLCRLYIDLALFLIINVWYV